MSYGIYAHSSASSGEEINAWVSFYDPDAFDGGGDAHFTNDPIEALAFADAGAAMEFWRQASTVRPLRPDGKPNRPLTAFTVSVMPLPVVEQ